MQECFCHAARWRRKREAVFESRFKTVQPGAALRILRGLSHQPSAMGRYSTGGATIARITRVASAEFWKICTGSQRILRNCSD